MMAGVPKDKLGKPPESKSKHSADGLSIELDKNSRSTWKLVQEMQERAAHLRAYLPFLAAMHTYQGVVDRIPNTREWESYRSMLRPVRVGPKGWKGGVYAVYGRSKPLKDRNIDSSRSLLYVHLKLNRLTPPSKEVKLLAKYNPWTMETLPFSPEAKEAILVVRKVSRHELKRVTDERKKQKHEWAAELEKLGIHSVHRDKKLPELKTKIVQDIAFQALRLEFGYGGLKPTPHWRPAILESVAMVKHMWKTRNHMTATMFKENETHWKRWPPKMEHSIRIGDLKNLEAFQKRLRVHG